jgi:hypothetical protein
MNSTLAFSRLGAWNGPEAKDQEEIGFDSQLE